MNEQTPRLGLPLPHPENDLQGDVLRLRAALQALDGHVGALQTALQSDDVTLDQLQELVDAIKDNRGDIAGLLSVKANASALQAEVAARQAEDQALLASLEAEVSARQQALTAEAQARAQADQTLQQAIEAEALTRQQADQALLESLQYEAAARQSAITAESHARQQAIEAEAAARQAAVTELAVSARTVDAVLISTATQAEKGKCYVLTASLTLTLPENPAAGDVVRVVNQSGSRAAVVARNGRPIMGLAEDMVIDALNASVELMYADATRGWVLI